MLTEYNSQDAQRLIDARLTRFQSFVLTNLNIKVDGSRLIFQGADPKIAIAQANTLLQQAAIILGTSKLEIFDTDNNLVFAAELKSEQTHKSEEAMTIATAARSVEFDITPVQVAPNIVPYQKITSITGETEEELRSRLQALGTPFYWSDDSWAVAHEVASQLVIHFRMEQGRIEAAMLLDGVKASYQSKPATNTEAEILKPEFQPLKRGVTPTLEKYLTFAGDTETRRTEILNDIAQENTKGKRHLTKIVNSYPPDMKKPTRGEFQVAAQKLMAKRTKQPKSEGEAEAETTATEEATEAI